MNFSVHIYYKVNDDGNELVLQKREIIQKAMYRSLMRYKKKK